MESEFSVSLGAHSVFLWARIPVLLKYYTVIQHYLEIFIKYSTLFLYFVLNSFSIICNVKRCTSVLVFCFFYVKVKCASALET